MQAILDSPATIHLPAYTFCRVSDLNASQHMGTFPHQMQYFAAAGENDDFVIAVINFQLNQYF